MGIPRGWAALEASCALLTLFGTVVGPVSALVGTQKHQYRTSIRQVLPPGAWKKVRDGGCLVGLAPNLVVDPALPNINKTLAFPDFIGGQLCDWLDVQWLKHTTVGKAVLKKPTGLLKFFKRPSQFLFEDHLEVIITYIDLIDYERVSGINGHVPLPWAAARLRYNPPTHEFGESVVSFIARGGDPYSPTEVYFLLASEFSRRLRQDTSYTPDYVSADFAVSDRISEGTELGVVVEQPLLLQNFLIVDGACAFLDGRLQTTDLQLCRWADTLEKLYPSSSAIMHIHKLALFNSNPAGFLANIELQSPEYSHYGKLVRIFLKPSTPLAGIFQERHDYLIRKYRE
ncbi:conserved hypothetical protein [Neospora caninum Liverpool]|uniref:Uncharacterized protein n=1 Tax=Neospora caninum (strain Liverpool) TaxID=572307 RepID=F0VMH0_NEOCL|nr:conserved hypothetical protein [Neospora caninum Liverpool]CBZ54916.1 conserved hypothetical protein [Neospora caninum Liverpool]CEL69638.1 TPA: hypothetical protein BN1204_053420 [Neospora caninum Liverpool]|eukprot:XP_003884944.1 conserved hypothetical protein [Neospora caninum Liverpool]